MSVIGEYSPINGLKYAIVPKNVSDTHGSGVTRTVWRVTFISALIVTACIISLARWGGGYGKRNRPITQRGPISSHRSEASNTSKNARSIPNIVLIYIDDQGFNDMGPNSTDLSQFTPFISELAQDGIWLTNYYGLHVCTPSRAALMTGNYPISVGMSHGVISGNDPWGLPLLHKLLPQYLKDAGNYRTHMLGKWHLGHYNVDYTPLLRGFDKFFGYFSGFQSYFSHVAEMNFCAEEHDCYYDLRDDWTAVRSTTYNAYLFNREATKLLDTNHLHENSNRPFFLYYAMGNVHFPVQAPETVFREKKDELAGIPNIHRRAFAAMTMVLDDAVGNLTAGLIRNSLYENTCIVIASDNGGLPTVDGAASNWPLRGMKNSYWEGGVRVHALVRSSLIPVKLRGTTYNGIFHVTDWLPTLIGGMLGREDVLSTAHWDGINQWDALVQQAPPPRNQVVFNIDLDDQSDVTGAIRVGHMKLLVNVLHFPIFPDPKNNSLQVFEGAWMNTVADDYMFNLTEDPTESNDLKESHPDVFREMYKIFSELRAKATPPAFCGLAENKAARSVFNTTQFIAPWSDEITGFNCLEIGSDAEVEHSIAQRCLYGLLPKEQCAAQ